MLKKFAIACCLLGIGSGVLWGTSRLGVYGRALVAWARQSASVQVPVELDIRAAKTMLADLDKKIENALRSVSRESVEVRSMEAQFAQREADLKSTRDQIVNLRTALDTNLASAKPGQVEMQKAKLAAMFATYEHKDSTHQIEAKTLENRRLQFAAAELKVAKLTSARQELRARVDALEAQRKLHEAARIDDKVQVDDSEISDLKNMVGEIEKKLNVEEEFHNRMEQLNGSASPAAATTGKDLLDKIDQKFGKEPAKTKGTSL